MAFHSMACKWGAHPNYLLNGMILQVVRWLTSSNFEVFPLFVNLCFQPSAVQFLTIIILPTQNNALNRGQALKDYKI